MANTVSAKKRARQSEKRRQRNMGDRSEVRTAVKKIIKAILSGDKGQAQAAYKESVPVIDHMANKGLIHKNKAARHKSRLNAHIHAMQS